MRTFKRVKNFFSSGENGQNMKRKKNVLHTMYDSQLIKHQTLDRARIMFVTDLIRDTLTSLPSRQKWM